MAKKVRNVIRDYRWLFFIVANVLAVGIAWGTFNADLRNAERSIARVENKMDDSFTRIEIKIDKQADQIDRLQTIVVRLHANNGQLGDVGQWDCELTDSIVGSSAVGKQ